MEKQMSSTEQRSQRVKEILDELETKLAAIPKVELDPTPMEYVDDFDPSELLGIPPMTEAQKADERARIKSIRRLDQEAKEHGEYTIAQILGSEELAERFLAEPV